MVKSINTVCHNRVSFFSKLMRACWLYFILVNIVEFVDSYLTLIKFWKEDMNLKTSFDTRYSILVRCFDQCSTSIFSEMDQQKNYLVNAAYKMVNTSLILFLYTEWFQILNSIIDPSSRKIVINHWKWAKVWKLYIL